jgi:ElaB/YqjD/DUF883 family membrane-anchored ribosome-binding protein
MTAQGRKATPEMSFAPEPMTGEERARNLYLRGKDKVVHAEKQFEGYVAANPVKSVLIAVGVGAAVGFLIGRKR